MLYEVITDDVVRAELAVQLAFSQFVGAWGEWEANRIWKEDVRNKQLDDMVMNDVWFRNGDYIVRNNFV